MQQGFCPAASLCEVTVHHTFGNRGGAVGCGVRGVRRMGDVHCPRGGAACPGWATGGSPCFHALVCSCTSPQPHQPWPHCCCPAARHSLISPGARSGCADALFPAPNSQPPALTTAFLGQLREGRSSQDCLTVQCECHPALGTPPSRLLPMDAPP